MSQKEADSEGLRRSERNRKGKSGSLAPSYLEAADQRSLDFDSVRIIRATDPAFLSTEDTSASDPMAGRYGTRLKYRKFKGDGRDDVDDWLCEFNSTAAANQEEDAAKLRLFQGLLKGEALQWYQDIPEADRTNWERLTTAFLRTFREVGGEARTLGKLSKMRMKPDESVRRYGQRVRSLIHRLTPGITASVQIEWYVAGFPEDMGFHVRQARPQTLQEAMEAAQNYENSKQSLHQSGRRAVEKSSKRGKKLRAKRRKDSSDSSTPSSESTTDPSSSPSDSDGPVPVRKTQRPTKAKDLPDRARAKVKEESSDDRRMMKDIQSSLSAIKIHLADSRKNRKMIPVSRNNVWCTRCGQPGHYPNECPNFPPGQVQYVDAEGTTYLTEAEFDDDVQDFVPVYQVLPTYGRGRGQPHLTRPRYQQGAPPQTSYAPRDQSGPSGYGRSNPTVGQQLGLCFKCGQPGHYAANCPYAGGQGAPLQLPCQNCGQYGHTAPQCNLQQQPRVFFKQVEVPPREQTALNYGNKAAAENPPE